MLPMSDQDRILTLEINQRIMAENISEIKKEVKEINEKFDVMIEKMEKKFAAKWVEWVIKWLVWIILCWFASALLTLILR